jgi:CubicO group peptidase (beta-lactamase class C family)
MPRNRTNLTSRILSKSSLIITLLAGALFSGQLARSEDQASRINQYLNTSVAKGQFRVNVLVAHGDLMLIRGEYSPGRQVIKSDEEYRVPIGTIAEQFLATAVLKLEQQGKVRIDAPICVYVAGCPSEWKDVKVVHLLTHTSGLPSLKPSSSGQKEAGTLRDLLVAVNGTSLEFKPGSRFKYNALDDAMLHFAVDRVSGRPTKDYIETEIFHAQGMTDTEYPVFENLPAKVQKSYLQDGESWRMRESQFCEDNLCSTVGDLYRWERALAGGTVVSRDSLHEMFTPYRDGRGLGWKINKEFDRRVAVQNGRAGGASVSIRLYPDDDICIILVAHSDDIDPAPLTHDIGAIVFGKSYPVSTNVGGSSTGQRFTKD